MSQAGFTPIQLYFSTTAAATPSAGNLANGELALNITDGKLYYKNNSGVVTLLASAAGASGDVVGPASATDNALVRFDSTTGKLVQNSVGILDDSGNLTGLAAVTMSGALTLSGGTANGVAYLNGSKVLTTGSALTFDGSSFRSAPGLVFGGTNSYLYEGASDTVNLRVGADGPFMILGQDLGSGVSALGNASGSVAFYASNTEQMRLTSTGLGIGTSFPGYKLDVNSGASTTIARFTSTGTSAYLGLTNSGASAFIGADNTGALLFQTPGSAYSTKLTIDTSGNLGLGVTPSGHLPTGYGGPMLQVGGRASILGSATTSAYTNNTYYAAGFFRYIGNDEATMLEQIDGAFKFYTAPSGTAGNAISFTQAMTLDASGNLAIGRTAATTRLHIKSASDNADVLQIQDASEAQQMYMGVSAANGGPYLFVATNQALRFGTNNAERARIDSSGRFNINTTGSYGGLNVDTKFGVLSSNVLVWLNTNTTASKFLSFEYNGNEGSGSIVPNGTTSVSYNTNSDYRLKENIQPMTGALAFVRKQRPVTYKWKADGSEGSGYIAHWMQEDGAGQCVTGEKDAVDKDGKPQYQGIDTSFMVGPLNAALNELADIVDAQATLIQTLTARVAALESN
jgi:hypothetical protein